MEISLRLIAIQKQIAALRRKGRIHSFPEGLKREVLDLCDLVGMARVAHESGLAKSMLYTWKNGASPRSEKPLAPIEVTRVSLNPEPQSASGAAVAILKFSAGTMEIHCPKVALQIASSLLGGRTS